MVLEGGNLEALQEYQNMPVDLWGTIDRIDERGVTTTKVDRFEVPFPDLEFQKLKGTINQVSSNGNSFIVFDAEDGSQYAYLNPDGTSQEDIGIPAGMVMFAEALLIPGESFEGYPGARVFALGEAINPATGEEQPFGMSAGTIESFPDYIGAPNSTVTALIDLVELTYFTEDPRYSLPEQQTQAQYIQPVWRFFGHYTDGSLFEILVQAVTMDYLLPEPQSGLPPG
jgi:hypothetical protein